MADEAAYKTPCEGCGVVGDDGRCLDDLIDVVRLACGCISVNGQGHLPYKGEPCGLTK